MPGPPPPPNFSNSMFSVQTEPESFSSLIRDLELEGEKSASVWGRAPEVVRERETPLKLIVPEIE